MGGLSTKLTGKEYFFLPENNEEVKASVTVHTDDRLVLRGKIIINYAPGKTIEIGELMHRIERLEKFCFEREKL